MPSLAFGCAERYRPLPGRATPGGIRRYLSGPPNGPDLRSSGTRHDETVSQAKRNKVVDERLWIRTSNCDDRDYLVGNSHTFPGRMYGYCPTQDIGFSVSLSEIDEMSSASASWVAGFLAGNEPRPEDMFGPGVHDAYDSEPRLERWRRALDEFRASGEWPHARWEHLVPFPPGTKLPPFVWTLRGDEVWTWNGDDWVKADPQPRRQFRLLEGTVCFRRGHCDATGVTTVHVVCDDCGDTTQCIPDGFTAEEWERAQYVYQPAPL